MSAHTPGPWGWQTSTSDTCEYEVVQAIPNGDCVAGEYGIAELADARLIAAAPDIFEALRELIELRFDLPWAGDRFDRAEAAIAKATGGQP